MNAIALIHRKRNVALLFFAGWFVAFVTGALAQPFGGGSLASPESDCIGSQDRTRIEQVIAHHQTALAAQPLGLQPAATAPTRYPFFPQAGNLWGDLFVNNFTDLDSSSGIRDWDCTDYTYDGHRGHDVDLRSFGEQALGVPIFAALDGTVTDRHDGEFDMQTQATGAPANYVILHHGGTHYTWYWHMKNGSVAVALNQVVKAGTLLGLTASSGNSTAPHLHFESRHAGTWYEPSAGLCRAGESYWVRQTPVRRDMYLRDVNVTGVNIADYPGLPFDMPRIGTFVSGVRTVGFWILLHNMPANRTWRVRFLRPDNSTAFDSGTGNFNNPFYRWSWWWWRYNVNLNVPGAWRIELLLNNQSLMQAPFNVVASAAQTANRPPNPITVTLDPAFPLTNDVVFCRVTSSLIFRDPDYEIIRYRYQWKVNGETVRDVTHAGMADAIPPGGAQLGDTLTCVVAPNDASTSGPPATVETVFVAPPPFIVAAPQTRGANRGSTVTFNVTAGGALPLFYQWIFNDAPQATGTNASLILTNVQNTHEGDYRVIVSNSIGSVTSAVATLTLNVPAGFAQQPQSQTVLAGSTLSLSVVVTGTPPIVFLWRRNSSTIVPFALGGPTLTLTNVQLSDSGT